MGQLVIISGPSGVGKSSVVQQLMTSCPLPLALSVSATTRQPRPGETSGRDYYFLSPAEFQRLRLEGQFLECTEVFGWGHWYGTLREPVTAGLNSGKWIILEIDVEGTLKVLAHYPQAITIFIHPGEPQELERRLRGRSTEDEATIQHRLTAAQREIELSHHYQHVVVNREVAQTAKAICELLMASA